MWFWWITVAIIIAGAIGGVVNAFMSDSGFILPGRYEEGGTRIWKPGALGNVILGAAAAFISWGLYGPFTGFVLMPPDPKNNATLTLSVLVGAFLAGIGGAKIVTSEVEKNILSRTAVQAATLPANPAVAGEIASSGSPSDALAAVTQAQRGQPQQVVNGQHVGAAD